MLVAKTLKSSSCRPIFAFKHVRFISANLQDSTRQVFVKEETGARQGISILTLNRPEAKNALGRLMISQFRECLDDLQVDVLEGRTRVVIVKSLVDRVFCAGADLKERLTMSQSETGAFVGQLRSSFSQLEQLGAPTIACIEGAALGGGLELALCCDLRVASGESVVGLPETKLAIIPGAGGTQRLPRLIGVCKAKELIFTGRRLTAQDALNFGILNRVSASSYEAALELAEEILPQGPVAVRMAKLAIDRGIAQDIASGLGVEQLCYAQVIPTQDRIEGLKAFQEKRKPSYIGK